MGLAKINGIFRLTRDAELKYTQDGKAILNIRLACSEKFRERENQLFLDATAFGKPAEILNQYAGEKGTQIFLSGKLHTESWEKEGVKHSKTKMTIESFDFISKARSNDGYKPNQDGPEDYDDGTANPNYDPNPKTPYKAPTPTYEPTPKHTDYKPAPKMEMPVNMLPDIDTEEIPF